MFGSAISHLSHAGIYILMPSTRGRLVSEEVSCDHWWSKMIRGLGVMHELARLGINPHMRSSDGHWLLEVKWGVKGSIGQEFTYILKDIEKISPFYQQEWCKCNLKSNFWYRIPKFESSRLDGVVYIEMNHI